ncbi:hypothetical protein ES705_28895 [subsurface metagenome]
MTKQGYEQVRKHQQEAYDTALEMIVENYMKNFQKAYDRSYKAAYLNNRIHKLKDFFDKDDLNQKDNVLAKFKDWSCIKGNEYQKVMKLKALFDNRKSLKLKGWTLNENMTATAVYECLQRLIKLRGKPEKGTGPDNKQTKDGETDPLTEKTRTYFKFMLGPDPRKHCQILTESDFDNLIIWITAFLKNDNFKVPEINQPIRKVNTAKANVIFTFISFFDELHPEKTRPDTLFKLMKCCFKEYRNDKIENLKKSTKMPQNYKKLNNNYNDPTLPVNS